MNRILISNSGLYEQLKNIDLNDIYNAIYSKGTLTLYSTTDSSIDFDCEGKEDFQFFQVTTRWDRIFKTVKNIEEQPICLEFFTNGVNMILSF